MARRAYALTPGETEIEVEVTGKAKLQAELWPLKTISADRLTT